MSTDNLSLKSKESELFSRWMAGRDEFIKDGLVNEDSFSKSKFRPLVILKEVNSPNEPKWDLVSDSLVTGAMNEKGTTWINVARWIHGIENLHEDFDWSSSYELFKNTTKEEFKIQQLKLGCFMNLKKSPGGGSTDQMKLKEAALRDQQYILEQIELYEPRVIICGGTGDLLYKLMGMQKSWKKTARGMYYFHTQMGVPVIAMPHPAARMHSHFMHYALVDAVSELLLDTGHPARRRIAHS